MSHEHDAAMTPAPGEDQDQKKEHGHGHGHSHDHAPGHTSAKIVALGTVTVGGATFTIDREGQVEAGKETEFGVEITSASKDGVVPTAAWIANPDGKKLCDPVKGDGHDSHWHFKVEPFYPVKKSKFVLQVGEEEAVVDWARGAEPRNDGILSVFKAVQDAAFGAFLELKLHGDAGDLELWLYQGFEVSNWSASGAKPDPFDVPKETVVKLTFPTHGGKSIELRVRNADKNEDEDGTPTMRDGRTNYFIFPGESGQDPEWLMGEKWRGLVTIAFEADGKSYLAEPFVLVPHEAL